MQTLAMANFFFSSFLIYDVILKYCSLRMVNVLSHIFGSYSHSEKKTKNKMNSNDFRI